MPIIAKPCENCNAHPMAASRREVATPCLCRQKGAQKCDLQFLPCPLSQLPNQNRTKKTTNRSRNRRPKNKKAVVIFIPPAHTIWRIISYAKHKGRPRSKSALFVRKSAGFLLAFGRGFQYDAWDKRRVAPKERTDLKHEESIGPDFRGVGWYLRRGSAGRRIRILHLRQKSHRHGFHLLLRRFQGLGRLLARELLYLQ